MSFLNRNLTINFLVMLVFSTTQGSALSTQCLSLLDDTSKVQSSGTSTYLNLFRSLVKNKNSLTVEEINVIRNYVASVNPFDVINIPLPAEQVFAYKVAFEKILNNQESQPLDWRKIQTELGTLARNKRSSDSLRESAEITTAPILTPIVRNNYADGSKSARVVYTMDLPDGGLFTIIYDPSLNGSRLVDARDYKETALRGDLNQSYISLTLRSGAVLFSAEHVNGDFDIYEITPQHEVKLLKQNFKRLSFKIPGQPSLLERFKRVIKGHRDQVERRYPFERRHIDVRVTELPNGDPGIIETIRAPNERNQKDELVGFLEINLSTGEEREIPFIKALNKDATVARDGRIISYEIDPEGFLTVKDLRENQLISRFVAPPDIKNHLDELILSSDDRGALFLINSNKYSSFRSIIDLNTGMFFDIPTQFNGQLTLLVVKSADYFTVLERPSDAPKNVAVYDELTKGWREVALPIRINKAGTKIVTLSGGHSVLVAGSAEFGRENGWRNSAVWFPLESYGFPEEIDLKFKDIGSLFNVRIPQPDLVEGLFQSAGGFTAIQLYGRGVR